MYTTQTNTDNRIVVLCQVQWWSLPLSLPLALRLDLLWMKLWLLLLLSSSHHLNSLCTLSSTYCWCCWLSIIIRRCVIIKIVTAIICKLSINTGIKLSSYWVDTTTHCYLVIILWLLTLHLHQLFSPHFDPHRTTTNWYTHLFKHTYPLVYIQLNIIQLMTLFI